MKLFPPLLSFFFLVKYLFIETQEISGFAPRQQQEGQTDSQPRFFALKCSLGKKKKCSFSSLVNVESCGRFCLYSSQCIRLSSGILTCTRLSVRRIQDVFTPRFTFCLIMLQSDTKISKSTFLLVKTLHCLPTMTLQFMLHSVGRSIQFPYLHKSADTGELICLSKCKSIR